MSQASGLPFVDEFREKSRVLEAAAVVQRLVRPSESYHFMEFCGGHTHVVFRYGLKDLLPGNLQLVHGPGCPVCVLPRGRIDSAIELARSYPDVVLCTFADLMRVPGSGGLSLIGAKAAGADIRMVYSPDDALRLAEENPARKIVFLAIGFETTAPSTAFVLKQAKARGVANFFVYCLHLLTPPAVQWILESPEVRKLGAVKLDGFIGPGHVSSVVGALPYERFADEFRKPVVVAGFTPLDMIQALAMLVQDVNDLRDEPSKRATVKNQYSRVVARSGNRLAQAIVAEAFEPRPVFEWRGLGEVPFSAFRLRDTFAAHDAEKNFDIRARSVGDHPACQCGAIIRGLKTPLDCKVFAKACTPENPMGSCMVSSEGTCAAYYSYRKR